MCLLQLSTTEFFFLKTSPLEPGAVLTPTLLYCAHWKPTFRTLFLSLEITGIWTLREVTIILLFIYTAVRIFFPLGLF